MRAAICAGAAIWMIGCGAASQWRAVEYMPDMARGPAYKAFAPNPATPDGLTLRPVVAGAVPRGYEPFHYGPGEEEAERAGRELHNPYPPTESNLKAGRYLFDTYCAICHGESGKGDGPIAAKIPPPPTYTSGRLMQYRAGRFFHVMTMGYRKMPSYAAQLSASERWKIAAYIRTELQKLPPEEVSRER